MGPTVVLRAPEPGDLGWVVERHGALYSHEYGWDERFEGLVAEVVADYAKRSDRGRNAAWIAELDGRRAGYDELVLWTNDVLASARPIYEAAGFELVGEKRHSRFGPEVVGQDWALSLGV